MNQYLILLAIIPLSVFHLSKMMNPRRRWLLSGFATGLVIAPVSMGLIEFTYVPIIGKALGLVGVVGNLIHGSIGYFFLVTFGGLEPGVLLSTSQLITINLVNAGIWGPTTAWWVITLMPNLPRKRLRQQKRSSRA